MNPELQDLFRQKGELVTQLEVAQGKLQGINQRIAQILSQPPVVAEPPKK